MIKLIKSIFMCPKKKRKLQARRVKSELNHLRFETLNKGDLMDYDGMGDWGRFPPIKK